MMAQVATSDTGGGAKQSTTVNIENLSSAISSWSSAVNSFSAAAPKASSCSGLTTLESAGLCNGFPASYDSMLSSLSTFLSSVTSTIETYCNSVYEADKAAEDEMPEEEGAGDGDDDTAPTDDKKEDDKKEDDNKDEDKDKDKDKKKPTGGGNNNNNNNDKGNNDDYGITGEESATLTNNLQLQSNALSTMSLNDLSNVASILSKLAAANNVTIDELLGNKVYAQQIRSLLTNSGALSESYRNLLAEGTADACQTALKNVFNGKNTDAIGLNTDTTKLMKSYLEDIATANNTTYDALFETNDGKTLLKKSLQEFTGVSEFANAFETDGANSLSDLYNSSEESKYKSIVKKFVDISKGESDVDSFAVSADAKSSISNLGKMSIYASNLSTYKDDSGVEALKTLLNKW